MLSLKLNKEWGLEHTFRLTSNSSTCLQRQVQNFIFNFILKLIFKDKTLFFHYIAHTETFQRRWFRQTVLVLMSRVAEKI